MTHDGLPAYGLWSLAIVNSLVFIVFAFSFFRPRTRRDWRTFGAFSGFIVALFAEMYGFPLTIYLLSGWLGSKFPGVDFLSHDAGHLLEVAFGWRSNPHFGPFHVLSFAFIGGGFWLLSAAWQVLYNAQRAGRLAQTGPYAHLRHPQYVAFVLIMFGFLVQWPTILTLAMFPILCVMYVRLAIVEEKEAAAGFGEEWQQYARGTPRFFPRLSGHSPASRLFPVFIAVAVAATWYTSAFAQSSPQTTSTRTSSEGGVTLEITPRPAAHGGGEWEFAVKLDTHSGALSDDLVNTAVLLADDHQILPSRWTGAGPGGHHREGVLTFPAPTQPVKSIELRVQRSNETAARIFRWDGAALR